VEVVPPAPRPAPPSPLISPEIASPPLASALLRLHAALEQRQLWETLRGVAREALPAHSLTLEIGGAAPGGAFRSYRHAHPAAGAETRREHPACGWLAEHPGVPVLRLSDVVPLRILKQTPFHERVMRREGWDKQLSIYAWRGRELLGAFNFFRTPDEPDFSAHEWRTAEALQPHFDTALRRVLEHEEATFLGDQFRAMLESVPVGMLLLDWELRPRWWNGEAAHACAVWNHGERSAAALNPQQAFRVPAVLATACAELRTQWLLLNGATSHGGVRPRVLSDDALGLHAQIIVRTLPRNPLLHPAFEIQLDHRRPRGDRHRPLSPGAVALLARLSAREREVAIRVREGLRTAEIAAELRRSPLTIKTQLASIFAKLQVRSRTRVATLLNR
jgi:DNA-binding CsgD family transcriptional regulator/PAS domain-containing protein